MIVGRSTITDNPHVNNARALLAANPGYSQQYRYDKNGRFYDCSSFVQKAYGIPENIVTATMPTIMPKYGYTFTKGLEGLRPGDILWRNGHTEIYTGDGYTLGAHSSKNGVSEYSYKGNLDQYAGYFRPPSNPMSSPAQAPFSNAPGSKSEAPLSAAEQQHEPAGNQTWLGNGYRPAGAMDPFSMLSAVINSNPYTRQAYAPIANAMNVLAGSNLSWTL